jgi:transcriptional regulator with XRE-family HTH domain
MAKGKRFSNQIRLAVDESGVSNYRIAADTGISEAILSRFKNGKSGLSLEKLDTLADYIGFECVPCKPKGK